MPVAVATLAWGRVNSESSHIPQFRRRAINAQRGEEAAEELAGTKAGSPSSCGRIELVPAPTLL